MRVIRTLAMIVASAAAEAALLALPTAAVDLVAAPLDFVDWWDHHGTGAAAIGIVHLAAMATAAYVTVVLSVALLAELARLHRLARGVLGLAPTSVRRRVATGLVAGALAMPTTAVAQEPIVLVDTGPGAASEPIVLADIGPSPAAEPIVLTDLGPAPDDSPDVVSEPAQPSVSSSSRESFRRPSGAPTPDAWLVEPGDHLWAIAEATLAGHGRPTDDASIERYWRALIETNRATIADPDLIHPGQVVVLPDVVTAGS